MDRAIGDEDRDKPTGPRHQMPARPGAHTTYDRGEDLVVEWYDFGPDAPYESANLLIFDRAAQAQLAALLDVSQDAPPDDLARRVAAHFTSYFEVWDFARKQGIPFRKRVNFWP